MQEGLEKMISPSDDFDFKNLPSFDEWASKYVVWKREHLSFLASPLPDDIPKIEWEYQNIPRLYSAAGRHESLSEYYYYQAKEARWREAVLDGQPKSACLEIAKTQCSKEELLRIDARNIREDLRNRGFKIEQIKKHLETPANGY